MERFDSSPEQGRTSWEVIGSLFLLRGERNKINIGFVAFAGTEKGPRLLSFHAAPHFKGAGEHKNRPGKGHIALGLVFLHGRR